MHDSDEDYSITIMKRISAIRHRTSPVKKSVFTRLGGDVTATSSTTNTQQLCSAVSDVFHPPPHHHHHRRYLSFVDTPKWRTLSRDDVMWEGVGAKNHFGDGGGVSRATKKRLSAPSSVGGSRVNKSRGGGDSYLRKTTTTPGGGKVTKMAAGKRVSMAIMDQIMMPSTSSVLSRLGTKTSTTVAKKSKSMTNLAKKSRVSGLLLSSGGRVRAERPLMTSQSLKRGGGGSVFDRLGGR